MIRILSVDPGFDRVGIALIEKEKFLKEKVVMSTCISTNKSDTIATRLFFIYTEITKICQTYFPTHLAIESLFFTKNQKTAISVAEARGVVLCLAGQYSLKIHEYTPLQVKSAVAGYGKATKDQVQTMVYKLLSLEKEKRLDDEIDALAIGLTCICYERY